MFTERQKTMLKVVGRNHTHPDLGKENEGLEKMIAQLKIEASLCFLQPEDLIYRKFFHRPSSDIPLTSYIEEKIPTHE